MERPYFLQGDQRRPTYLWTWRSDAVTPVESVARGMGTAQAQEPSAQNVTAVATHENGQWRVLLRRALTTDDPQDLPFSVGDVTPMAFQAWDGDHGEQGLQGSISTWYFISLQQETTAAVYIAPVVALFLTLGVGLLVVSQAKKSEDEGVVILGDE
jgi:DMSO reductase family type II enzyme heme b subunit